jgi:hypothetical protein
LVFSAYGKIFRHFNAPNTVHCRYVEFAAGEKETKIGKEKHLKFK